MSAVWFIVVLQVLVPPALLLNAWREAGTTRLRFVTAAALAAAYTLYIALVGRWDFVGYFTWMAWVLACAAVLGGAWRRVRRRPWHDALPGQRWVPVAFTAALAVIFLVTAVTALRARRAPDSSIELRFPFGTGWFYVAHGGTHMLVNAHHPVIAQRYALDIVALSPLGFRAGGLYPVASEAYRIWGAEVRSPGDGLVVAAVDGLPDLPTGERDPDRLAGNHVILRMAGSDVRIVLAHLQRGSVRVREGDAVRAGVPVGRVGNSGNTTEPHLHVHAVRGDGDPNRDGAPVPLRFDGRFLVRNHTVRRPARRPSRSGGRERAARSPLRRGVATRWPSCADRRTG